MPEEEAEVVEVIDSDETPGEDVDLEVTVEQEEAEEEEEGASTSQGTSGG